MTNPSVQVDIKVQADLDSIARAKLEMERQLNAMAEKLAASETVKFSSAKSALKQAQSVLDQQTKANERVLDQQTKANERALDKQIRDNQKAQQKITDDERREQDKRISQLKKSLDKEQSLRTDLRTQFLGAVGGYRLMRAGRLFNDASELNKARGGDGGISATIETLISELTPLAIGVGAVKTVFEGLKYIAMSLAGAFTELAGAKGLQGLIIEAAKDQSQAASIAGNANLHTNQIQSIIVNGREGTNLTNEQLGEGLGAYSHQTGQAGNASLPAMAKNIANLSQASKRDPAQVGNAMGMLKHMHPNFSDEQINQLAIQEWHLGTLMGGTDPLADPDQLSKITDLGKSPMQSLGILAKAQARMGGKNDSKAIIQKMLKYTEGDNGGFNNLGQAAMNANANDPLSFAGSIKGEYMQQTGDQKPTAKAIQKWIDTLDDGTEALKHAQDAQVQNSDNIQDTLESIWNDAIAPLKTELKKDVEEMIKDGSLKKLSKDLREIIPLIGASLKLLEWHFQAAVGVLEIIMAPFIAGKKIVGIAADTASGIVTGDWVPLKGTYDKNGNLIPGSVQDFMDWGMGSGEYDIGKPGKDKDGAPTASVKPGENDHGKQIVINTGNTNQQLMELNTQFRRFFNNPVIVPRTETK